MAHQNVWENVIFSIYPSHYFTTGPLKKHNNSPRPVKRTNMKIAYQNAFPFFGIWILHRRKLRIGFNLKKMENK